MITDLESNHGWPMDEYMPAWKTFRKESDENKATADFLLGRNSWPKKDEMRICDIGCADGQLLETLLRSKSFHAKVTEATLIDPHQELLAKAVTDISRNSKVKKVTALASKIEDVWPRCAEGVDVVLAVHVVYLLSEKELQRLVFRRPDNSTLYVVLDAPDSVFTELWAETAPKYHDMVLKAHELLRRESGIDNTSTQNRIRARLPRRLLRGHDLSNWLLSILCYTNMLCKENIDRWGSLVQSILDKHVDSTGQFIECTSVCYELVGP